MSVDSLTSPRRLLSMTYWILRLRARRRTPYGFQQPGDKTVLGKSSSRARALTCTTNRWGARNKLRLTNWDLWLSPTPPEKLIKDQIKLTIWTISLWPWAAPRCRGVSSPRLVALIRAPLCISSSTILKCPSLAAQCNGLKPWSSLQKVIGLRSQSNTVNPCHSCDAGWTC